jgi:hypothetical protein
LRFLGSKNWEHAISLKSVWTLDVFLFEQGWWIFNTVGCSLTSCNSNKIGVKYWELTSIRNLIMCELDCVSWFFCVKNVKFLCCFFLCKNF